MSDSADASMNGFMYQRYQAIKLYLEHKNNADFIKIGEECENSEDVDFVDKNNKTHTYQVKYYTGENSDSESLCFSQKGEKSGFYKVVERQWKRANIEKIYMLVYNHNKNPYAAGLREKLITNKEYHVLGKYFLLLNYRNQGGIIKNEDDSKIILSINMKSEKINSLFDFNKEEIKKVLDVDMFDFFVDNSNDYFGKIKLLEAENFDETVNQIEKLIEKDIDFCQYFDNDQTKNFSKMKISIIKNKIFNILNEKMFKNDKDSNLITIKMINNGVIENIDILRKNPLDLMIEYFKSVNKIINQDNIDQNDKKELCNDIENQIINIIGEKEFKHKNTMIIEVLNTVNTISSNKNDPRKLKVFFVKFLIKHCGDTIQNLSENELSIMSSHFKSLLEKTKDIEGGFGNKHGTKVNSERKDVIDKLVPKNSDELTTNKKKENKSDKKTKTKNIQENNDFEDEKPIKKKK